MMRPVLAVILIWLHTCFNDGGKSYFLYAIDLPVAYSEPGLFS